MNISVSFWSQILNIAGLVLDALGGAALYFLVTKGFGYIDRPDFRRAVAFTERAGGNAIQKTIEDLQKAINKALEDSNTANDLVRHKSKKWFVCIVIGFALQLISALLQF